MRVTVCILIMLLCSCTTTPKTSTSSPLNKYAMNRYDLQPAIVDSCKIAVICANKEVEGSDSATDLLTSELLDNIQYDRRMNIILVERSAIETILEQYDLQSSGLIYGNQLHQLGKMHDIDYLLLISYRFESSQRSFNRHHLGARLVDIDTGEILLSKSNTSAYLPKGAYVLARDLLYR